MTITYEDGILEFKDGWVSCLCGRHFMRVNNDTTANNLPVMCRHCKRKFKISITK